MKILPVLTLAFAINVHAAEDPFAFDAEAAEASTLRGVFLLDLRQDRVRGLPRPQETDVDRWEARTILGFDWRPAAGVQLRATGRAFRSEQANDLAAFNLDNERLNETALDELFADGQAGVFGARFGQSALPLELSPMVWDADLRWRGLQLRLEGDGIAHGGGLSVSHGRLEHGFGSDVQLGAAQAHWRVQYGAAASELRASLLAFDRLETLPQAFRSNSRDPLGGLASGFRVADAQFVQRFGAGRTAWRIGIDLARNLAADSDGDAGRFDLRYGDAWSAGGLEIGAAIQRIQADAVPAAFNDDDWWFPTRMRGHAAWLAYGLDPGWGFRAMALREKRDDMTEYTQRLLFDVTFRY